MVKHVLLFKLKEMDSLQEKVSILLEIKVKLEGLKAVIPAIKSIEVGINQNQKEEYDLALITTHDDWEGLAAYRDDPKHLEVAQFIGKYRVSRSCADFEF